MEDIIEKWLGYEPRRVRPKQGHSMYPLTVEIIKSRMKAQLPLNMIKNKKILDLGCSVPFNEIWCRHHDAKIYHGVELFESLANIGNTLVSPPNKIFNKTIENFVNYNDLSYYDTIIAQSSLNTVDNFFDIFKKICMSKADIIFESTSFDDSPMALIKLSPEGVHNTDKIHEVINVQNFYPNLQAVKVLARSHFYAIDVFPNNIMKQRLPIWSQYKFCCWLKHDGINSYQYIKEFK